MPKRLERRPAPSKHLTYHRLLEQFGRPGCALCGLGAVVAARHLESLAGEHLTDPKVRERLRASLGFCPRHAYQLVASPNYLAVAILYEDFLQRVGHELEDWAKSHRRWVPPCPACAFVHQEEEETLRVLAQFLDDPEMATAYENSSGLCLDHTLRLCRRLKEPARGRVIAAERSRIERLRAELAEVIRKHDYRYRGEPWGEEKSAPGRAVAKLAGEPDRIEGMAR
jgi:uncharacterized protein DUF6062